jgi:hypothetical protein
MSRWTRRCIGGLALVAICSTGCSRSNTPSPVLNLAGTWSGTLFHPGGGTGGTPMQMTWVASQKAAIVTGTHTLMHPSGAVLSGTLTGSVTGSMLALTETVPAGNVPGFPNCSFTAASTLPVTANSIAGNLTTTFRSCDGFNMFANGSVPAVLALTK